MAPTTPIPLELTINPTLCSGCGKCCTWRPGRSVPSDWGDSDYAISQALYTALASGNYTNDPWEGDPREDGDLPNVPMIRPNGRAFVGELFHAPWFEEVPCVFLGDAGCTLEFTKRPYQCRALMPGLDVKTGERHCETVGMTQHEIALSWVPYRDMVRQIINDVQTCRDE